MARKTYKQVKVKLTPEQYEDLVKHAQQENLKLSSYVRKHLNMQNELDKGDKNFAKIIYHLNKIGNNINQIAKRANIQKQLDYSILQELKKIEQELDALKDCK